MVSAKLPEKLYDVLYADGDKIASLYAQLFGALLTSSRIAESDTDSSSHKLQGGPSVLRYERESAEGTTSSSEKTVTPHDITVIDVMTILREAGFVRTELAGASLGSIILMPVRLVFFDTTNLSEFIKGVPTELITGDATGKERHEKKKEIDLVKKMVATLFSMIPMGIQIKAESRSGQTMWGTIKGNYLRELAASILLKHGLDLQGEWLLCAIVDSLPSRAPREHVINLGEALSGFRSFGDQVRAFLGRSDSDFGISPIAIIRELARP